MAPKHILAYLALFLLVASFSYATDDKFILSTDRSEYYFQIGLPAQIIINTTNNYNTQVDGLLTYSMSQKIQTQNSVMQSQNSDQKQFVFKEGDSSFGLTIGNSQSPGEIDISFVFDYDDPDGNTMKTALEGIKVFFVQDKNQDKHNQEQKQSTTKSQEDLKKEQERQQQEEQLQREAQQRQERQRQQQANQLSNKLQNNQAFQDANALKQQMRKDIRQQELQKEAFKKELEKNQDFQKRFQDIVQRGFNQSGAQLDPTANDSGGFKVEFQDQKGNNLTLQGDMRNSTIHNMKEITQQNTDIIRELISKDPRYANFDGRLTNNNYSQKEWSFQQADNQTKVTIPYLNQYNQSAKIEAALNKTDILDMSMSRETSPLDYLFLVIIILLAFITAYVVYSRYKKAAIQDPPTTTIPNKPFDYKKEARRLMEHAKSLFHKGEHKEAYSKASQAIRVFFSHKLNLNIEMTNTELINALKNQKIDHIHTQNCLNICSLVNFAKYNTNKKDFDEIIELAEKIIR